MTQLNNINNKSNNITFSREESLILDMQHPELSNLNYSKLVNKTSHLNKKEIHVISLSQIKNNESFNKVFISKKINTLFITGAHGGKSHSITGGTDKGEEVKISVKNLSKIIRNHKFDKITKIVLLTCYAGNSEIMENLKQDLIKSGLERELKIIGPNFLLRTNRNLGTYYSAKNIFIDKLMCFKKIMMVLSEEKNIEKKENLKNTLLINIDEIIYLLNKKGSNFSPEYTKNLLIKSFTNFKISLNLNDLDFNLISSIINKYSADINDIHNINWNKCFRVIQCAPKKLSEFEKREMEFDILRKNKAVTNIFNMGKIFKRLNNGEEINENVLKEIKKSLATILFNTDSVYNNEDKDEFCIFKKNFIKECENNKNKKLDKELILKYRKSFTESIKQFTKEVNMEDIYKKGHLIKDIHKIREIFKHIYCGMKLTENILETLRQSSKDLYINLTNFNFVDHEEGVKIEIALSEFKTTCEDNKNIDKNLLLIHINSFEKAIRPVCMKLYN